MHATGICECCIPLVPQTDSVSELWMRKSTKVDLVLAVGQV